MWNDEPVAAPFWATRCQRRIVAGLAAGAVKG